MTTRTIAASLSTAALLSVGMTACSSDSGGSTPDAATLTSKAKQNATSARSSAMKVSGSVQGQTVTLEVAGSMDHKNQHQQQSASKLKSEEYVVNDMAYFKANSDFMQANGMPSSTSKTMADKWWSKPLKGDSQSASIDVKGLINQFFSSTEGKKLDAKTAQVKQTTTDGKATYTVSDPKNTKGAKLVTTRDENPQIVQIQDYASELTQKNKATYTFSKWNAVETYKAPAGAKPIEQATKPSSSSSAKPSSSASASR